MHVYVAAGILPQPTNSTLVLTTRQKPLDVLPPLNSVHQLNQTRKLLKPLPPVLRQILIMTNLVHDQVRVRDLVPDHIRSGGRERMRGQMPFQRLQEVLSRRLLMLRVLGILVRGEEGVHEARTPCYQSATNHNNRTQLRQG